MPDLPTATRHRRLRLPLLLALPLARICGFMARRAGGGGTTLPGRILLGLRPSAIADLRGRWNGPVIAVSATNGKTTTASMLAHICRTAGMDVVHNAAGANLRSGIATTLIRRSRRRRTLVLEVDEATLARIGSEIAPDVLVLGNLFRDQLDRYGELDTLVDRWRALCTQLGSTNTVIVANSDDPTIAAIVRDFPRRIWFGCADERVAAPQLPHAADANFCPACAHPLAYTRSFVGHLGHYSCANCGFARPMPNVELDDVVLHGLGACELTLAIHDADATEIRAKIRIPGLYNAYNALAAGAAAFALGLRADTVQSSLQSFSASFGRFERISVPDGTLTLLLVKNPTALNEVIRTLVESGIDLAATMIALNDGIADGRDVSWIWDADLAPLLAATSVVVASGDRAAELGLRCIYDGVSSECVLVEPDLESALYEVLARARDITEHGHAYALVTYTAMLQVRQLARERGWVSPYWQHVDRSSHRRNRTARP